MAVEIEFAAIPIKVTVNGVKHEAVVEPRTLLVYFLREHLNLTGTHVGCDTSQCGACTIQLNGRAVKSCTILAVQANGTEITTVEGLAREGVLHPVQEGFREKHGLQCGYCTPGMIMTAVSLLETNPNPTEDRNLPCVGRQPVPLHGLHQYRRINSLGRGKDGRQKCFPLALATSRRIQWRRRCSY